MKKLLDKMTVLEKLGQLVQIPPFFFIKDLKDELYGPAVELGLSKEDIFKTGSVLGIASPEEMILVQSEYLKNNRLGIPLLFMADIIHGYETIFPIPLAIASSFNLELALKSSSIAALEASLSGIHVTFSPMGDVSRDPRWGRVMEAYGEDSYLNYLFSYYAVKGYQGDDIRDYGKLAACFKHFAGYALSEAGRDYNTVDLSEYNLKQNFLSGYRGAIKAGAKMAMTSFNLFEGVPATINKKLITKILRNDLEFNGVVISDYNGIRETITHGISENDKEAATLAMLAGLDIEMVSATYMNELEAMFTNNLLDIKLLDEKVLRVLNLKNELGLFNNPYKDVSRENHDKLVLSDKHLEEALKVSLESIVLLKNNQVLPLTKVDKVYLAGPNIDESNLNGAWSWHGKNSNETLRSVLTNEIAITSLENSEYVIYFGGEKSNESGEAKSKTDINFAKSQLEEIKKYKALGKKIILVIASGRPLVLTKVEKEVDAILQVWFLGTKAAKAISDTLLGVNNPSAKLPMSFPRSVGQIPIYYNYLPTGRPKNDFNNEYTSVYIDSLNDPLYSFGFGLSYSNFIYSDLKVNNNIVTNDIDTVISIKVKNDSNVSGFEVIQLYVHDLFAKVSRPVKELKAFKKVFIPKKSEVIVEFIVDTNWFLYYDNELNLRKDKGDFNIYVGSSSLTTDKVKITYE